ncbi:MAG: molybdopterin-synthase adenylyltransferase MoeB [Hyphomicrobiales bacterium]|uniref:HesA/MoeB/ThiF family protein n=1 Tax=Rhabdaerophilum calidifontis TaxID=2604328 RepID=UPI00123BE377|nr:molybdopterin-synthase adenylyltransferase MoeB [Rhabdaerophilum calidifontis]MCA1952333.1 molybdopterin-synthase adenylyltransferase MoeB [Hyphomicrobiales bacterium]MCA1998917.1 molybdopterin-synthase adenylyltransferase MoeB [Hyphomicrobiales bacterium]
MRMLSNDDLSRFARHIVLRHVGGPGQQRLRAAKVLVVGAGGLGSPLLLYLAAAGIGTLGIVDDDRVSLSNLQRQVIHRLADLGRAKTDSAGDAIRALDPGIRIAPHPVRLDAANAAGLVADYDVIADGSDNFDTRYTLAEACEAARKPLVTAAVNEFHGAVTVLRPWEAAQEGGLNPRYRDLYPDKPPPGAIPTCAEAGVLGALCGLVGSLQAIEVIRQITPFGTPLIGRLLMIDALDMRFETLGYSRLD